jgi:hypothetical protein
MQKTIKTLFFIALFLSQSTFAQSPWTREKGKAYVQLGFSGIFFNEFAGKDGKAITLPADYSDVTLQLYSEYGITSKLETQLILPFRSLSATGNILGNSISKSFSGLGNVSLGLKYKIIDSNWKLSSGLLFTPKTSQYDSESSFSTGFNATTLLPYITLGSSSGKWYYYGNIGYGYMTNDFSDYFRFNAEVGYNVIPKGYIMITIDTRNIVSEEDAFTKAENQTFSYSDRQTYNAFGLKLNYEFVQDKFGTNFSIFGAAGNEYTPLAPSFNFGAYVKL